MFAFFTSVVVDLVLIALAFAVLRRRPKGTPLTWGEAFVGAVYVWAIFLLTYAIVPHQFITMCDKDFGWRSDIFGIPTGPFYRIHFWPINHKHLLWPNGVTFFGRGRIHISQQTLRDILVSGIYVVGLVAHGTLWSVAQRRGEKGAEVVPVSPYGRPLVRKA